MRMPREFSWRVACAPACVLTLAVLLMQAGSSRADEGGAGAVRDQAAWTKLRDQYSKTATAFAAQGERVTAVLLDPEAPVMVRLDAARLLAQQSASRTQKRVLDNLAVVVPDSFVGGASRGKGGPVGELVFGFSGWDLTSLLLKRVASKKADDAYVSAAAKVIARLWPKAIAVEVVEGWRRVEQRLGNKTPSLDRLIALLRAEKR